MGEGGRGDERGNEKAVEWREWRERKEQERRQ